MITRSTAQIGVPKGQDSEDAGPLGAGCQAFTAELKRVDWPTKFRADIQEKYDGSVNSEEFLQIYTTAIHAAGGGPKLKENYFHVALHGRRVDGL
jgi:hypothetical protein